MEKSPPVTPSGGRDIRGLEDGAGTNPTTAGVGVEPKRPRVRRVDSASPGRNPGSESVATRRIRDPEGKASQEDWSHEATEGDDPDGGSPDRGVGAGRDRPKIV